MSPAGFLEVFLVGKKTVMIADDSIFTRNFVKKLVIEAGAEEVIEAKDGREAIEKYEETKPELVLMDIMMPNVNGLEAIRTILEKHADAKIVMYTASNQEMVIKEALNNGALDFLPKPMSPEALSAVVKKYLSL
jgi:two-component system, chemotaxis family, chemotaxis protein CheY